MSNAMDGAIAELQDQLRALEDEAGQLKTTINLLCKRVGRDPIYADIEGSSGPDLGSIRADTFYGQATNTAARMYLEMRKNAGLGPATVREIFDAMVAGGYESTAKNEENAMRSLRIALSKSSHTFHRLPGGEYGLLAWYPNVKAGKPKSGNGDTDDEEDSAEAGTDKEADGKE
ncbi:MAG: hypothetical protein ACE37H_09405 [Phycisphaeraceae bacterium]